VVLLTALAFGWRPLFTKPEVLVVLRSGETLRGVLLSRRPTYLVLGDVAVVDGRASETSIDGTVQVDRENVTWVQVPK
jgi:small nuclear ribonucleoprotein (snRNP)-like protein